MKCKFKLSTMAELGVGVTAIAALLLAGCGGGGGGGGAAAGASMTITPSLGQFASGATVRVKDKNGTLLVTGTVNASGVAAVTVPAGATAPLLVEAGINGDKYFDENPAAAGRDANGFVTISGVSNAAVRALIPDTTTTAVGVTALTEMAVGQIEAASGIAATSVADIRAVNQTIGDAMGVTDILQPPTPVTTATRLNTTTVAADRYALVLAGLAHMAAAGKTALDVANDLRNDVKDGKFDGRIGTAAATAFHPAKFMPPVLGATNTDIGTALTTALNNALSAATTQLALSGAAPTVVIVTVDLGSYTAAVKAAQVTALGGTGATPSGFASSYNLTGVTANGVTLSGNLIAPVTVGSYTAYYWDVNGDGTSAGADYVTHDQLDQIFNGGTLGDSAKDTTDATRNIVTLSNGVRIRLLTQAELSVLYTANGVPAGWARSAYYWSATQASIGSIVARSDFHNAVNLSNNGVLMVGDTATLYVAFEVLGVASGGGGTATTGVGGATGGTGTGGTGTGGTITWGNPTVNTNLTSAGYVASHKIGFDTNGNAIAVWQQFDGVRSTIWASRYMAGSGWGAPARITTTTSLFGNESDPQVAVDANGNALAVWSYDNGAITVVWANRYTAGSGWGIATRITPFNAALYTLKTYPPKIAFDASGNALVIWEQLDNVSGHSVWINSYTMGSGWGIATQFSTRAEAPQIGFDAGGNAIATWLQWDSSTSTITIWARRYIAGSGWGMAARITPIASGTRAFAPSLTVDASGNGLVEWMEMNLSTQTYSLWANRYTAGAGWGTATQTPIALGNNASTSQFAFDKNGNAFKVWTQYDGMYNTNSIWANRYTVGSGWGTAAKIAADSPWPGRYPVIAVDASGNVLAVWKQYDGTDDLLWANRYTAGTGWGTAAPIPVSGNTNGTVVSYSVAVDTKSQEFVVTWSNTVAWPPAANLWTTRFIK